MNNRDVFNSILKVGKRIAITVLCCLPFLILFGYFTQNIITSNGVLIFIFVMVMSIAVLVEETIARKLIKKKAEQELIEPKKDVFK